MKLEGVILGAGLSRRMGTNKLALDLYGKTIIERCIDGMYELCSKIIVIGGHRQEEIKKILDKYPKVELIHNPDYGKGMFSSVKKGISYVKAERFFLTPGDYPVISKKTYQDMLQIDEDIVVPLYNGKRGHPLLMKSHLIEEVLTDTYYKTLRDFINMQGFTSIELKDPGILMDIDTIEDYKKTLLYFKGKSS